MEILTGDEARVTASGRTDAGVHALGQVAHFDFNGSHSLRRLCVGLNGILPKDVSVLNAYDVDANFHARFSAIEREYIYVIYNHPQRSPFMMYRSMWINFHISEDYIAAALKLIEGEHDFISFCKKKSSEEGTMRNITRTQAVRRGDYIYVTICGNAFLHNMIRIIVGTCLEMFKEGREPESIIAVLDAKDRDAAGATAPPYGLYLKHIKFEPTLEEFASAFKRDTQSGILFDT